MILLPYLGMLDLSFVEYIKNLIYADPRMPCLNPLAFCSFGDTERQNVGSRIPETPRQLAYCQKTNR